MMKRMLLSFLAVSCTAIFAGEFKVVCGGGESQDFAEIPDMDHAVAEAAESLNSRLARLAEKHKILEVSLPQPTANLLSAVNDFTNKQMITSSAMVCVKVTVEK